MHNILQWGFALIKAVIFDMDGVIVDSEPLQYEAYNEVFTAHGAAITKREFIELWVGRGSKLHEHIARHGLGVGLEEVRLSKKMIYDRLVREKMQLRSGMLGLIKRLSREMKTALASSAHPDSVEVVLERFDLRGLFDVILTGGDVEHNKPHPEIYLKAAERLKVKSAECLVFEDSASGIAAAKDAGMRVIALPHEYTISQDLSRADLIITDLRNLRLRLKINRG